MTMNMKATNNDLVWRIIMMLVILCSSSSSSVVTSPVGDPCDNSNIIHFNRFINFDATSLRQCLTVWDSHNFILRYGEASPKLWSFLVSFPTSINSYGAMGFSNNNGRMVGSEAMAMWVEDESVRGGGIYAKYYLGGKTEDEVFFLGDADAMWKNDSAFTASSGSIAYMAFQLQVKKNNEPPPYLIFAVGPDGFFPYSPYFSLTKHIDHYAVKFDYGPGKLSNRHAKKSQGWKNIAGWSDLMIIMGAITYLFYY